MKPAAILWILLYMASPVFGDHPTSSLSLKVEISFLFPDGREYKSVFSHFDISKILVEKPIDKSIHVDSYKIDWWVYGALQNFNLPFEVETKGRTGYRESTITRIGDYANGKDGRWVYYVNGIKSKYHISTQLDEGVERIRFVYE